MLHLVLSRIWLQELTVVRGICSLKPMDQHHLTPFDLGTVSKLSKAENIKSQRWKLLVNHF